MNISLLDLVLLVLFFQLLTLVPFLLFQRTSKGVSNRILGMFLLARALCITNFLSLRLYAYTFEYFPHAFYFGTSFTILWGPLLFLYVRSITEQKFRFRRPDILHAFPFLVHFIVLSIFFHFHSADAKREIFHDGGIVSSDGRLFLQGPSCVHPDLYNSRVCEDTTISDQPARFLFISRYVGSSYQQQVYAFNPSEAELFWEAGVYGLNYGNPAVSDDYVLVGTGSTGGNSSGSLSLVSKQSHVFSERFNVDGWVETPLYLGGIVYFGCGEGKIYAVDTEELLNTVRPETILKDNSDIDLGTLAAEGTVSTSFYLNNIGGGTDSITDISTSSMYRRCYIMNQEAG